MTTEHGRCGEPKTSRRRLSATEKQAQALELRRAGASYRAIAQALAYKGPSSAYYAVEAALTRTLQEPADEVRRLELDRLDALQLAIWPKAMQGDNWAIDRVLQVMRQRAKLLGLNAPLRIDLNQFMTVEALRIANELGMDAAQAIAAAEKIVKEHQRGRG